MSQTARLARALTVFHAWITSRHHTAYPARTSAWA